MDDSHLYEDDAGYFEEAAEFISELEQPPKKWDIYTLKDARQPRPPTKWVVDGIVAEGTLSIVYGAPGSLKSFIIADMAVCAAQGKNWLIRNDGGILTEKTPLLWIDFDNGRKRTHERFDALTKNRNVPDDAPIFYISSPEKRLDATDINEIMDIQSLIIENNVGLVVLDNLGLISGATEENSSAMAQVLANIRGICEHTNAAIIVIHHQRKGGSGNSRAGDALRGHSSIEGAIDLALRVVRESDNNGNFSKDISIFSTKTRGTDVKQTLARFNYTADDESHDLVTAWFTGVDMVAGRNPVREQIIDSLGFLAESTKTKLVNHVADNLKVKSSRDKIRDFIEDMINKGIIDEKLGARNAKILRLKADEEPPI